ncbi:hypothetical protein [Ignatzschineria cameli]|uniref:hypothetical protein n=1 Tax=Ignatzschineria cameli TaxID=2182793 RepID=UPI00105825E0|nr:hypothetical protein [Ignatzschineria cameli]
MCPLELSLIIVVPPQAIQLVKDLQQYRPDDQGFMIYSEVKTLYGSFFNSLNFFKMEASEQGQPIDLPPLGAGKYHEIDVTIGLSVKVFYATYFPENPKPISPLYLPILNVFEKSTRPTYAPYNVIVTMGMENDPDPCVTPGLNIRAPQDIDFGTLNKEMLEEVVSERFSMRLIRSIDDHCQQPLYPIITFKATEPILNNEIQLSNGTLLSLDAVLHSPHGGGDLGKLQFNTPIRLGKLNLEDLVLLSIEAKLRKNPNKSLKGGPFSTTVIYHVEYR